MKIIFLADSDQPRMSGVGDYTLNLCNSLQRQGHHGIVKSIGSPTSVARSGLADLVQSEQPDWVSIQFVPYAYAKRGLVHPRTLPWDRLRGKVGTHLMFHEVWIGSHHGASLRERAVGLLQRELIKSAISMIRPDIVHCSNPLYSTMLARAGIPNSILPLFGSLPISSARDDPYADDLQRLKPGTTRSDWMIVVFFGNIYPTKNLPAILAWLHNRCMRFGKDLLVVSLGNCPAAEATFSSLSACLEAKDRLHFLIKGRQDASILSRLIVSADCGLSTTPFNIIEKSSSAVTFVEHGLPVIVAEPGQPVRGCDLKLDDHAPDYWLFDDPSLQAFPCLPPRRLPQARLPLISQQFLSDLNRHAHK